MTIYLFIDLPFNGIGWKSASPRERRKRGEKKEEKVKRCEGEYSDEDQPGLLLKHRQATNS